jgi:hypothetical protein
MSIEITTETDADEWNSHVEQSPQAIPFHRYEALSLIARETGTDLHTLVGFKGQEPVGVLPLFVDAEGPFTVVRSPPAIELFTLGPALLNYEKLKQRKFERRHRRFVEGVDAWIDEHLDPDAVDIRTVDRYGDVRPFTWNGFDVSPSYTYVLDLEPGPDALLEGFSRDARTNVRDARENDALEVREAGQEAIGTIIGQIRERHAAQDEAYPLRPEFVEELHTVLPDGRMRVYTLHEDGEVASGMVTYETDDTVYRWQGGAKTESGPAANDLLDWHIVNDAYDRGRTRYDLVGANDQRLCRYKSKFDPAPSAYYVARRQSPTMTAVTEVYGRLPEELRVV